MPLASACRSAIVLEKAWDKYEIPLPFSRVAVVLGAPMDPAAVTPDEIARALSALRSRAVAALSGEAAALSLEGK